MNGRGINGWIVHSPERQLGNGIVRKILLYEIAGQEAVESHFDVILTGLVDEIFDLERINSSVKFSWCDFDELVWGVRLRRRRQAI